MGPHLLDDDHSSKPVLPPIELSSTTQVMEIIQSEGQDTKPSVTSTKTPFNWEKLATELREKIFEYVIIAEDGFLMGRYASWSGYFRWTGVMPALIVAFRSLPRSHAHAMDLFAKTNSPLHMGLDRYGGQFKYFLNNMTKVERGFVKNVTIVLEGILDRTTNPDRRGLIHNDKWHDQAWFAKPFLLATNLRVVSLFMYSCPLSFDPRLSRNLDRQMTFLTEFPFWLSGCKALSKVVVEIQYVGPRRMKRGGHRKIVQNMIQRIYERTGVRARYDWWEDQQWIWKAASGKYMDWSQDLGLKWRSRPFTSPIGFWSLWEDEEASIEFVNDIFLIQNSRAHYDDWGRLEV